MLRGPSAIEWMGNIRGQRIVFSPATLTSAFLGLNNDVDAEAPISNETSEEGWKSMRGETMQLKAYHNKQTDFTVSDYLVSEIMDRCLILKSGGSDKIIKKQQDFMGAISLRANIRWAKIVFDLIKENVIAVRIGKPLEGRKRDTIIMYHLIINHFLFTSPHIHLIIPQLAIEAGQKWKTFDHMDAARATNVLTEKSTSAGPSTAHAEARKRKKRSAASAWVSLATDVASLIWLILKRFLLMRHQQGH